MKHHVMYALGLALGFLVSCADAPKQMDVNVDGTVDSLQRVIAQDQSVISVLRDSIMLLKYPADQRLAKARELLDAGELDKATEEIKLLKQIFPHSSEAKASAELVQKINDLKEAKRKEEERIKALGFKAIAEQSTVKIGYNTITLSNITTGQTFVFDSYDDRYFYRTADRGSKYVTMQMTVKSESHEPQLPELAIYTISGGNMHLVGTFDTRFARWSDYGAYLGNYHDNINDFAKVSTVRFKLGLMVENEQLAKPYAIVMKRANVLTYSYERFDNPPISYIGSAGYSSVLHLDDFKSDYVIVKRYNLK